MLVLKRKSQEALILKVPGMDPIRVTVCRTNQNAGWIGIEAAPEVAVIREELLQDAEAGTDALSVSEA